ncbi:hypothetical protein [Streptococcus anginosus]|uniref:hypothetical protein n=1 Tax=Streptococcus anginosus TaxID=1328 RepID=UPI0022E91459|nr:hypothetical protein [Streptococcus anginosus]
MRKLLEILSSLLSILAEKFAKFVSDYKKNKERLSAENILNEIKILDNSHYISLMKKNDIKYIIWFAILLCPFIKYYCFFQKFKVTKDNLDIFIIQFFIFFVLSIFFMYSAIKMLDFILYKKVPIYKQFSKYFSLFPPVLMTWFVVGIFLVNKNFSYLYLVISGNLILLWFKIRKQSIFQIEISDSSLAILLVIFPIAIRIFDSIEEMKYLIIFLTVLGVIIKYEVSKKYKIAQKIFEVQLLSNNPDYEELKKCYYHGGEKYKEKLLSTEKFLRLIIKKEVYQINYKRRRRWRRTLRRK